MLYGLFLSLILVLGAWLMGRMWQGRCMVVKKGGLLDPFFAAVCFFCYVSFIGCVLGAGKGEGGGLWGVNVSSLAVVL